MKKTLLCILALCLVLTAAWALADSESGAELAEALRQAGVEQPLQLSQRGDTAACFAETDGVKRLVLLERRGGAWQTVIDNPTALIQDRDWPALLLDSDNAVFWTYIPEDGKTVRYHSTRGADGTWGPVDQYDSESGYNDRCHVWSTLWDDANGGEIVRTFAVVDEDDNLHGIEWMQVLPAAWMADCVHLADFDISRFPTMMNDGSDYYAQENERFFREAAAALMPEYTFVKGMLKNGAMHFLMQKPDGSRVYVVCEYASHREVYRIESSPLPEDTVLGHENFTDSLWLDGHCVSVQLLYNGTAGLESIYDERVGEDAFLFFGERTVWSGAEVPAQTLLYGDHPWSDITQIDWSTLPRSPEEASARMDSGNYAMVVNPSPADRLHLRERADKGSRSRGKYYTGTPVTVSAQDGSWTQVVFGDWLSWRQGFMMRRYLTFGQAGSALRLDLSAMPALSGRDEMLKVYAEPQTGTYHWHMNADGNTMKMIGIVGKDWYHVWFPASGEYGFVKQSDLTAGNG